MQQPIGLNYSNPGSYVPLEDSIPPPTNNTSHNNPSDNTGGNSTPTPWFSTMTPKPMIGTIPPITSVTQAVLQSVHYPAPRRVPLFTAGYGNTSNSNVTSRSTPHSYASQHVEDGVESEDVSPPESPPVTDLSAPPAESDQPPPYFEELSPGPPPPPYYYEPPPPSQEDIVRHVSQILVLPSTVAVGPGPKIHLHRRIMTPEYPLRRPSPMRLGSTNRSSPPRPHPAPPPLSTSTALSTAVQEIAPVMTKLLGTLKDISRVSGIQTAGKNDEAVYAEISAKRAPYSQSVLQNNSSVGGGVLPRRSHAELKALLQSVRNDP
eukprot:PhF_6_TR16995/c0_g1_i1/m.25718